MALYSKTCWPNRVHAITGVIYEVHICVCLNLLKASSFPEQERKQNPTRNLCHLATTALLHSELHPTISQISSPATVNQHHSVFTIFCRQEPKRWIIWSCLHKCWNHRIFPPREARRSLHEIPVQCIPFVDNKMRLRKLTYWSFVTQLDRNISEARNHACSFCLLSSSVRNLPYKIELLDPGSPHWM